METQNPEAYQTGRLEWLAACILEDSSIVRRTKWQQPVPYYMLMPTHPALAVLLAEYKKAHGIPANVALSDMERTMWELKTLNEDAVAMLAQHYAQRKEYGRDIRRAIEGTVDFMELLMQRK